MPRRNRRLPYDGISLERIQVLTYELGERAGHDGCSTCGRSLPDLWKYAEHAECYRRRRGLA